MSFNAQIIETRLIKKSKNKGTSFDSSDELCEDQRFQVKGTLKTVNKNLLYLSTNKIYIDGMDVDSFLSYIPGGQSERKGMI